MKIERLKPFTFSEMVQIMKLYIGKRIVNSVPKKLESTSNLMGFLNYVGVKTQVIDKETLFFEYNLNGKLFKIYLKTKSSDIDVFKQIIMDVEYNSVVNIIKRHNIPCTTMLDAGANIGLTSIYFKSQFPNLNIIALEPSDTTFKRLERNISKNNLEGVQLLKKGIWGHNTYLSGDTSFGDGQDWAFRLVEASQKENGNFEVVSIFDVINEFKLDYIDFLKIDIEGGEESVFGVESNIGWLRKVRLIAVEIHDDLDCRNHIETMLLKFGFILSYSGELTIGLNRNLLTEA